MIEEVTGDILSLEKGILVHGCNCHGAMGGGIARLIRDKWYGVFQSYQTKHRMSGLQLGDIQPVCNTEFNPQYLENPKAARHLRAHAAELPHELIVVNAMTQYDHGRDPSTVYVDYDAVFAAFARINILVRDTGLPVHFPLIGCGLANGSWDHVSRAIEQAMDPGVKLVLWKLPQ